MTPGTKEIVTKVEKFTTFSAANRAKYEKRWSENLRLIKGLPEYGDSGFSEIRQGSKLYFRKIESANMRIVADFVRHFLSTPIPFEFKGNMGDDDDFAQAAVFHEVVSYYYNYMKLKKSLIVKHIMLLQNIMDLGWGVGKLHWEDDFPVYTPWKNEHTYPDFNASFLEDMKFLVFENFVTEEDLKKAGYSTKVLTPIAKKVSELDTVRGMTTEASTIKDLGEDEYPKKGSSAGQGQDGAEKLVNPIYRVEEAFYVEGSKLVSVILNGENILREKDTSVFDSYPAIFGSCLLNAHQLIGEGSAERLEGPQRSINNTINARKDNVALNLNQPVKVERDAGVDVLALRESEPGQILLMDELSGVEYVNIPDVTHQAYVEVEKDEQMIEEMLGTNPSKMGNMGASQKATTARINLQESNAKFSLYTTVVGETYFKQFFFKLGEYVNKFASDKKVRRIANKTFRNKNPLRIDKDDVKNLKDINKFNTMELITDVLIDVGLSELQKDSKLQQILLLLEKSAFINTSQLQLLQAGLIDPTKIKLFNPAAFAEEILRLTENKNIKDFIYEMPVEQGQLPEQSNNGDKGTSAVNPAFAGAIAPQIRGGANPAQQIKQETGAE